MYISLILDQSHRFRLKWYCYYFFSKVLCLILIGFHPIVSVGQQFCDRNDLFSDFHIWQGDIENWNKVNGDWVNSESNVDLILVKTEWDTAWKGIDLNFTLDFAPSNNNYLEFGWYFYGTKDTSELKCKIGRSGSDDGINIIWKHQSTTTEVEYLLGEFGNGAHNSFLGLMWNENTTEILNNGKLFPVDEIRIGDFISAVFYIKVGYTVSRTNSIRIHSLRSSGNLKDHHYFNFSQGDLIVTEWNLTESNPLYIEIYNTTDQIFCVEGLEIEIGKERIKLPFFEILPFQYRILSSSESSLFGDLSNSVILVPSIPIENEYVKGGRLIHYDLPIQYIPFNQFTISAGAIEMISIFQPCLVANNWTYAKSEKGSPGRENTQFDVHIPLSQPLVNFINDHQAIIEWPYWISDSLLWRDWIHINHNYHFFKVDKSDLFTGIELENGVLWTEKDSILLKAYFTPCMENELLWDTSFLYTALNHPLEGDIVVSEIMVDPQGDCPEYIELYNTSLKYLDLSSVSIQNSSRKLDLQSIQSMSPQEVLVVARMSDHFFNCYPLALKKLVIDLPLFPLNNQGANILLIGNQSGQIDDASYLPSDFHPTWISKKGIALERRLGNIDETKWKSGYAHYGFNSATFIPIENRKSVLQNISFSHPIMTPNGDGNNDDFTITMGRIQEYGSLTVYIFDVNGKKINTLANNKPVQAGDKITWEGLDDQHRPLSTGLYLIWVYYYNFEGNKNILKTTCALSRD